MSPSILPTDLGDHRPSSAAKMDDECKGLPLRPKQDMQDTASQSDFLGLPGEVRNKISRYAITSDQWIGVSDKKPGLLFVNRQLRSETVPIYLTENKFEIDQAVMLSKCATAALLHKFRNLDAINVFTVQRWSFSIPVGSLFAGTFVASAPPVSYVFVG